MKKKIAFVGGGALGLTGSVYLKKICPECEVFVIEKDIKLGRKLAMTGSGKCNIAPKEDDINRYNNPDFVRDIFSYISFSRYLELLKFINIETKMIKDYGYYPYSESAPTVVKVLLDQIKELDIKVINDELVDYLDLGNKVSLKLKDSELIVDKVVFALGGNYDANLFKKYNIEISKTSPGLCPVKIKENVKDIFGFRQEAIISYEYQGKIEYQEYGEIMFKKDALSGIAVMNISSLIARKYINSEMRIKDICDDSKIYVDLLLGNKVFPQDGDSIETYFNKFTNDKMSQYLIKRFNLKGKDIIKNNKEKYYQMLSHLEFNTKELYSYTDAQVTVGGINPYQCKNKNIYFGGEMLNIDGQCGGYNLRYVISHGFLIAEDIAKEN